MSTGGNNVTGYLWIMCDLQSFQLEDSNSLNCSNYCGTVDEECNSTSVGDAQCVDVGCSGPGKPTCTSLCRLDYSSCSADVDEK